MLVTLKTLRVSRKVKYCHKAIAVSDKRYVRKSRTIPWGMHTTKPDYGILLNFFW